MRRLIIGLLIALLLAAATLFVGGYLRFLLGQLAVAVIAVASLSLLGNMAGMISLASAAFMRIPRDRCLSFCFRGSSNRSTSRRSSASSQVG